MKRENLKTCMNSGDVTLVFTGQLTKRVHEYKNITKEEANRLKSIYRLSTGEKYIVKEIGGNNGKS